jgi:hypothetical protein
MWVVIVSEFSYSMRLHRRRSFESLVTDTLIAAPIAFIAATIAFGGIHSRVIFLR